MLKFFRNIRHKLLAEGKTINYLKYAFGEIVLVVIGILIALQINNWNEHRKQAKNYIKILKTIRNDMVVDTTNIRAVFKIYDKLEPAFLLSMKDTISKDEYLACTECPQLLGSFDAMLLQTVGYHRMQAFNTEDENEKDSLNQKINAFYTSFTFGVETAVNATKKLLSDNTDQMRETEAWFKDWLHNKYNDEFYDVVLHDPFYKNRIAEYYLYIYKYYMRTLNDVLKQEKELLGLIDLKIETAQ